MVLSRPLAIARPEAVHDTSGSVQATDEITLALNAAAASTLLPCSVRTPWLSFAAGLRKLLFGSFPVAPCPTIHVEQYGQLHDTSLCTAPPLRCLCNGSSYTGMLAEQAPDSNAFN